MYVKIVIDNDKIVGFGFVDIVIKHEKEIIKLIKENKIDEIKKYCEENKIELEIVSEKDEWEMM